MNKKFLRGQIWDLDTGGSKGSELSGKHYGVIVSTEGVGKLPQRIIVPITSWKSKYAGYPWMVNVLPDLHNNLDHESAVDTLQIRSMDEIRLLNYLGDVNEQLMLSIGDAIKLCLELE